MKQISENSPTLDRNAEWNQLLLPASSKFVVVLDFAGLFALYSLENISDTKPCDLHGDLSLCIPAQGYL